MLFQACTWQFWPTCLSRYMVSISLGWPRRSLRSCPPPLAFRSACKSALWSPRCTSLLGWLVVLGPMGVPKGSATCLGLRSQGGARKSVFPCRIRHTFLPGVKHTLRVCVGVASGGCVPGVEPILHTCA